MSKEGGDHGHGDDKDKDKAKKKKTIWAIVAVVISFMVGLIVLFAVTSGGTPVVGGFLVSTIHNISTTIGDVGMELISARPNITLLGQGALGILITVAVFLLMGLLVAAIMREARNETKEKKEEHH